MSPAASVSSSVSPAIPATVATAIPMSVSAVEEGDAVTRAVGRSARHHDRQNHARENGNEHPVHDTPLMSVRPTLERGMAQ